MDDIPGPLLEVRVLELLGCVFRVVDVEQGEEGMGQGLGEHSCQVPHSGQVHHSFQVAHTTHGLFQVQQDQLVFEVDHDDCSHDQFVSGVEDAQVPDVDSVLLLEDLGEYIQQPRHSIHLGMEANVGEVECQQRVD